jgi:NADH dehydrogenase
MSSAQTQKKHIVAVGGGFASVKLALELANHPDYEITLISPHDQLEYHGALYRSATGRSPLEVVLPFREIFAGTNVTIVNDYVIELRAQTKEIRGQSGRTYSYDAIVLGLGYEIEYYGIRGMREHAQSIYTIYDTIKLRNTMRDKFIEKQGQKLNIVMVGGGPTGVEVASDIAFFTHVVAQRYNIQPVVPTVTILDRAPRILPTLLPEVSNIAMARLEELDVRTQLGVEVDHCTAKHISLKDGQVIPADLIVWSAGSRANSFFERYPDLFSLDGRKRVIVNEFMQANSPDIYVLGDSASTKYSGMAQTAITDAVQLAENFKRLARNEQLLEYTENQPIYVVPIGLAWAVAQVGDKISVDDEGWKIRRDADYFVLSNFLPDAIAKEHWEAAFQIAQI